MEDILLDDELDDELLEVPFSSELSEEASLPGKKLEEGFEHWRIEVDKGQTPVRVDKFLMDHMPGTSRNRIQKAAEAGTIRAGDKPVKSNYKVKPGDIISLVLDHPKRDWEIVPEDIPLDVVYEDDVLLVVNKPAGLVVHPGCGNYSGTLVNALVWGPFADDEGTITGNIGRHPKDRLQMDVYPMDGEVGKPAITHYKVLERFGPVTLVECHLETGRTHQIRAHMRHIGHPLFADERYGGCQILRGEQTASYKAFIHNCLELCPRQALHAKTLGFAHPTTGKEMFFSSELPDDFEALLNKWRKASPLTPLRGEGK